MPNCLKIVSLLFLSSNLFSQTYWVKYGWQVFENGGDARILSLGSAGVTDTGTSISPLFNPASSKKFTRQHLNYTHQSRLAGMINSDLIGFSLSNFNRPINIILLYEGIDQIPDTRNLLLDFGLDGIPGTGDIGENNGQLDEGERLDTKKVKYFSQKQFGMHVSTAWDYKKYHIGVGLKNLFHSLGDFSSMGIGMDLGFLATPWKNGKIGLHIRDVTTSWQVWSNGTVERFKPIITSGVAHNHSFKGTKLSASGAVNLISNFNTNQSLSIDENDQKAIYGVNIKYDNILAVRFGRNKVKSKTFGVGLSWSNISLDYAFLNEPLNSGLGSSHLISVVIDPNLIFKFIEKI